MPEILVNLQNAYFIQAFYKMPEYFNPFSTNCLTHFSHFNKNEFKYETAFI
jgi:hypothetical protein